MIDLLVHDRYLVVPGKPWQGREGMEDTHG